MINSVFCRTAKNRIVVPAVRFELKSLRNVLLRHACIPVPPRRHNYTLFIQKNQAIGNASDRSEAFIQAKKNALLAVFGRIRNNQERL